MSEEKLSARLEARAAEMDRRLGATDVQSLLREAAQLARRVEEAPLCRIGDEGYFLSANPSDSTSFVGAGRLVGQRVRLVREG